MECKINGTSYPMLRDFSLNSKTGNKTTNKVQIDCTGLTPPVAGDIIEITDGTTAIFWGTCGIPTSPRYSTGLEKHIYTITCTNGNSILANRVCNVAYANATVTEIVEDLFGRYIAEEGITLGTISDIDITLEVYTAGNFNLQSALNELASLSGAVWTVTPDKVFNFFAFENLPSLGTVNIDTFKTLHNIQQSTKDYKLRTIQYITGAKDLTDTQTEKFTYADDVDSFALSFPLASKPRVYVNGVDRTSKVGTIGIDDRDDNKVFFFAYDSNILQYRGHDFLSPGDRIEVRYTGLFDIRVKVSNDQKIDELHERLGTSGKIERVENAPAVQTLADAVALARSYIDKFSEITHECKFSILSSEIMALGLSLAEVDVMTALTLDFPELDIVGEYVIVERTLTPAYADMDDAEGKFLVQLVLMDRDYLKSYGEVLSDIQRSVNALSIRPDETIVDVRDIDERRTHKEETNLDRDIAYFCTEEPGWIFAPSLMTPYTEG